MPFARLRKLRSSQSDTAPEDQAQFLTVRALITGLIVSSIINLWLHHGELTLGGIRGHTALANTSIPVGAFDMLFALAALNLFLRAFAPSLKLERGEMMVIYAMAAVSTVLSSSGGLHFLLPVITAAHFFATRENQWAELFHQHIPGWMVVNDSTAIRDFYDGSPEIMWWAWVRPLAVWMGFLLVFSTCTLCIVIILRKLWVDQERLPFPTVALPMELTREGVPLFRNPVFWGGLGLTCGLQILNTISWNYPQVPGINTRGITMAGFLQTPPWDSIAATQLSVFGFAIGIGFLLSSEVAFSCWFFFVLGKLLTVWGVTSGWSLGGATGVQSVFPWLAHQGAGAFLAIALSVIWLARRHLKHVWLAATGRPPEGFEDEAGVYRWALLGLVVSFALLLAFCVVGGIRIQIAFIFLLLTLAYLIAATRTRAETGNAWPAGPDIDAYSLMMVLGGTRMLSPADITVLLYVRAATAGQDFRGACMPHQLDALKMAPEGRLRVSQMAWALIIAVAVGVTISAIIAVIVFTHMGALAKLDSWRSLAGMRAFEQTRGLMIAPRPPDYAGGAAVGVGAMFTLLLMAARTQWVWWPFHPVGYAMANTPTMNPAWVSMFIAWLAKVLIVKFGGMSLYRKALPFFFGLIAGDFLGGGLTTLAAILFGANAYPANW